MSAAGIPTYMFVVRRRVEGRRTYAWYVERYCHSVSVFVDAYEGYWTELVEAVYMVVGR